MAVIDPRLALARQQQAAQTAGRVTTLSQALAPAVKVAPTNPVLLEQLQLEELARSRFSDSQRQLAAMGVAQGGPVDKGGWGGFFQDVMEFAPIKYGILKPLEVLDTPRRMIISGAREIVDVLDNDENTKGSFGDWWGQASDATYGFGKAFASPTGNKWIDRAIGLVGDVLLDPLTYVTTGANIAARKGLYASGQAGRIAAATKVLDITGDAAKAGVAAKEGLAGARRVLTQAEQKLLGLSDSGLYMFGKRLPPVRIPLTSGVGDAVEKTLVRMRVAATSTRPGGWMQRMSVGKWLPEERLALLRGEVPTEQIAEKLIAVGAQDAYRATAASAVRDATRIFAAASKDSGIQSSDQVRANLYRLLENPQLLASATDVERRAVAVWQKAFADLWDQLDAKIGLIDDSPNAGFGRVQRYFPHVMTEEARGLLSGNSATAKKLAELFGEDAMGPTSFFNPRMLKEGKEFFGYTLKAEDLTVERLNQIARQYGKIGFDFFETDLGKVARGYAAVWSDQMGRMGVAEHLVSKGAIEKIGQKLTHDPSQMVAAQRELAAAMENVTKKQAAMVDAVRSAATSVVGLSDQIDARILEATGARAVNPAQMRQLAQASTDLASKKAAVAAAAEALDAVRSELKLIVDPDTNRAMFEFFDSQLVQTRRTVEDADAAIARLQSFEKMTADELVLAKAAAKEAQKELDKALATAERESRRTQLLLEYNDWIGRSYDDFINGNFDDIATIGFESGPNKDFFRELFQLDSLDPKRREEFLSKFAAAGGALPTWLKSQKELDAEIAGVLKGITAEKLKTMTHARIVELFDRAVSGSASHAEAQVSAGLVVARVLKFYGTLDNIPEALRPLYDTAVEDVKKLGQMVEFEKMALAGAKKNPVRAAARASKWQGIADDALADMDEYEQLIQREWDLTDRLQRQGFLDEYAPARDSIVQTPRTEKGALRRGSDRPEDFVALDPKTAKPSARTFGPDGRARGAYDALTEAEELEWVRARRADLEKKVYRVGRESQYGAQTALQRSQAEINVLERKLKTVRGRLEKLNRNPSETAALQAEIDGIVDGLSTAAPDADQVNGVLASIVTLQKRLTASQPSTRAAKAYQDQINEIMDQIYEAASANVLAEAQFRDISFWDVWNDADDLGLRGRAQDAQRKADEALAGSVRQDDIRVRVGGGNAGKFEWLKVAGKSVSDHRDDLMLRMEEFFIVAETSRRFTALTQKFSLVGITPSDRMLTDIMQSVRRSRRTTGWAGRLNAGEDALRTATSVRKELGLAAMSEAELAEVIPNFIDRMYKELGATTARALLGDKTAWGKGPGELLARFRGYEQRMSKVPSGPARDAIRADLRRMIDGEVKPWLEANFPLERGKWTNARRKAALRQASSKTSPTTIKGVESRLDEIESVIRSRIDQARKFEGLYRGIDDPDWSARAALEGGLAAKQRTPSLQIAARQSAAQRLERIVEELDKAVVELGDRPAVWQGMYEDAISNGAAMAEVARRKQAAVNMLTGQIEKLKSHPLMPKAMRDDQLVQFVDALAGIDPTRLGVLDWRALGVELPPTAEAQRQLDTMFSQARAYTGNRGVKVEVEVLTPQRKDTYWASYVPQNPNNPDGYKVISTSRVAADGGIRSTDTAANWRVASSPREVRAGDRVRLVRVEGGQRTPFVMNGTELWEIPADLPTPEMWETLFIGDGKALGIVRANQERRAARIEQQIAVEQRNLASMRMNAGKAAKAAEQARQTMRSYNRRAVPMEVTTAQIAAELVDDQLAKIAQLTDDLAEARRLVAANDPALQQAAWAWVSDALDLLIEGNRGTNLAPWLDRVWEARLIGVNAFDPRESLVQARRKSLAAAHQQTESYKLLSQLKGLEVRRGDLAAAASDATASMAEVHNVLDVINKELADLLGNDVSAAVRRDVAAAVGAGTVQVGPDGQLLSDSLRGAAMADAVSGVGRQFGIEPMPPTDMANVLRQQIDELSPTVGTTVGPAVDPIDPMVLAASTARGNQAQVVADVARSVRDDLAAGESIAAARAQGAASAREAGEKQLAELKKTAAARLKAISATRSGAEKMVGKATARINKAQTALEAAQEAATKAALKYDQLATATAADAAAQKAILEAAELQRVALDDFIDEFTVARARRVAGQESVSAAERARLQKAVEAGDKASETIARGTKSVSSGKGKAAKTVQRKLSDAEIEKLQKIADAGIDAGRKLAVASAGDMEAAALVRELEDVARKVNAGSGPTRSVVRDVLAHQLNAAFAAEVDFLTSGRALKVAEQNVYDAQYFATKLVPEIKEGWTRLEKWGLPSYQATPELVEMFNNVSRVQVPIVAQELSRFLGGYTRFFKAWAVATPGFHIRNALSNTFSVFSAGADVSNMTRGTKLYESWLTAMKNGIKDEKEWIARLPQEERTRVQLALRMMDAAGNGMTVSALDDLARSGKRKLFTDNAWLRANRAFGERVEGSARFMLAYDSAVKGMDLNAGSARVKRFLFDYSDRTMIDEAVGTVIPFWTWMSRNLPLQIVNRWANPRAYLMYNHFMAALREDDSNDIVPSWLKEQGAVSLGGGLYLNPDMPMTRVQEQLSMVGDPKRLLSMVNPAIRLPIELVGGRQLYNDVPFSERPQQITGGPLSTLLTPLLALAGQTETVGPFGVQNGAGRTIMGPGETATNAQANYALQNAIPFLGLSERLLPNTDQYDQRQGQSWLNFFGVPLREVTPAMRESEIERRKRQIAAMATAAQRLGYEP